MGIVKIVAQVIVIVILIVMIEMIRIAVAVIAMIVGPRGSGCWGSGFRDVGLKGWGGV